MTAFVYEAVRTPFGKFNGGLSGVRPDDLAATVLKAILERHPGLDPGGVEQVIVGTLAKVLRDGGHRWGVAAICFGVGQGLAVVLENVS